MSERVTCEACKRPMSAAAARCPHCAALQSRGAIASASSSEGATATNPTTPSGPGRLRGISAEEARALIAIDAAARDRPKGGEPFDILGWMFAPDPMSRGRARLAEMVLTVLALPVFVAGIIGAGLAMVAIARSRARGGDRAISTAVVILGAITLFFAASSTSLGTAGAIAICVGELLVLAAREWIRERSRARHGPRDLAD
jgi:hypothetical protein